MTPLAPDILDCLPEDVRAWVEAVAKAEDTQPLVIVRQIMREHAEYDLERKDLAA
jgi:hypothetical protein